MTIWFTSDLHFNHDKEFLYKPRGFHNVIEMNESIIEAYNKFISKDDIVYILGDLCLGGPSQDKLLENKYLLSELQGNINIILGNHDSYNRISIYHDCGFNVIGYAEMLKYNGYHFFLSHYPTITTNYDDKALKQRVLNLHGHTHDKNKFYDDSPFMYNVALDAQECKPISIESVINDIKIRFKEYREEYKLNEFKNIE